MRTFIALPLPDRTIKALCALRAGLRVGRPVAPGNLHLTLAFLDDQPETALDALHHQLEGLRVPSFGLHLAGTGLYGGDKPRLVYADAIPSDPLLALHAAVGKATRRAGITLARRRFHPHVTLARLGRADPAAVAGFLHDSAGFRHDTPRLTGFALFESILSPDGPRYDMLAQYPLIQ